jgi:hypothetical protein
LEKGTQFSDPGESRALRDYTLGPIYEALEKVNTITIMKMLKANGENA